MKVKLLRAFRVPGGLLRRAGSVVEVNADVRDLMVARGAIAAEDPDEVEEPAVEKPVDVEPDEVEEPAAAEPDARPAKTAGIAQWRAYAAAQGLDTKGLDKKQIIAALA